MRREQAGVMGTGLLASPPSHSYHCKYQYIVRLLTQVNPCYTVLRTEAKLESIAVTRPVSL